MYLLGTRYGLFKSFLQTEQTEEHADGRERIEKIMGIYLESHLLAALSTTHIPITKFNSPIIYILLCILPSSLPASTAPFRHDGTAHRSTSLKFLQVAQDISLKLLPDSFQALFCCEFSTQAPHTMFCAFIFLESSLPFSPLPTRAQQYIIEGVRRL